MVKEQFRETDLGRKVCGVQFCAGSAEMVRRSAHMAVLSKQLYSGEQTAGRLMPAPYGPLDPKLGTSQKWQSCATCGLSLSDCVGHFGYLDLALPVFHVGYFKLVIQTLASICKQCARVLLSPDRRAGLVHACTRPNLTYLQRKALHAKIVTLCKKYPTCTACGFKNGVVKKAVGAVLKIVHVQPVGDIAPFNQALASNKELETVVPKCNLELLTPIKVQELFERIPDEDVCLLLCSNAPSLPPPGIGKLLDSDDAHCRSVDWADTVGHPSNLLLRRLPVPPVCIRPSVASDVKVGTTEDDLTVKLTEIAFLNDVIRKTSAEGAKMNKVAEAWDYLQVQCALYINSELSGIPAQMQVKKFTRSFTQRLKGKQGRFRGNLSGKRVDFSGRTVISPDPNLRIDQVGLPVLMAKVLTYPERVTTANVERLRAAVLNGADRWPGANFVQERSSGEKKFLKYGNREAIAKNLRMGDVVERHVCDGDMLLFNRQPSLHKISIMCHRAKVMPFRTLRFNECACTPYNADFDGDEMNVHVPQTENARAEALELMASAKNTVTPRNGEPLVAAIQDFITSGFVMTLKDRFMGRTEAMRLVSSIIAKPTTGAPPGRVTLPHPAIVKPRALWTGKQLFAFVLPEVDGARVKLNWASGNKTYRNNCCEMDPADNYVVWRNGELLAGVMDKGLLGSGTKNNIFYTIMRDFGCAASSEAMWRCARMASAFLTHFGFSLGIGDVQPSERLLEAKRVLLEDGYTNCNDFIRQSKNGKLPCQPGCTVEQTLEAKLLSELSSIRDKAGTACVQNLDKYNAPLTMAVSGSKGSFINISQMIACVGQQAISGRRPPDGFERRSLPHFRRGEKSPAAKGFVQNSFYSGLTPTEFFFHTMAGREGLVDTAVKTAETGYMQRRLVKCLEDLCAAYDGTVRSAVGEVLQLRFGEDGLDPSQMEGKDAVLDLPHLMSHLRATTLESDDGSRLSSAEMKILLEESVQEQLADCGDAFKSMVHKFLIAHIDKNDVYMRMSEHCPTHDPESSVASKVRSSPTTRRGRRLCKECEWRQSVRRSLLKAHCLSVEQALQFLELCALRYRRAVTEPGVPRIKEIINAVKNISTPIIECKLIDETSEESARKVKARLEKTTLGEVSEFIMDACLSDCVVILVKVSAKRVKLLDLEVTMGSIVESICTSKMLSAAPVSQGDVRVLGKSIVMIKPKAGKKLNLLHSVEFLKYNLPKVVIKGLVGVSRCVIHLDEKSGSKYKLLVEGSDLRSVLATPGVDGTKTTFNNAIELSKVLGIETARRSIITEIIETMKGHGIGLDVRHVMLLADLMTYRGEVLGVTRTGLAKLKDSVLMLASFERTTDHLFEAAFYGQEDSVAGVSESIIMGMPMTVGTGLFKLLHDHSGPTSTNDGTDDRPEPADETQIQLKRRQPWLDGEAFGKLMLA